MVYDEYAFNVPAPYQVRVITDTDAKNEADDQFAIVHALPFIDPEILVEVELVAVHSTDA